VNEERFLDMGSIPIGSTKILILGIRELMGPPRFRQDEMLRKQGYRGPCPRYPEGIINANAPAFAFAAAA